MDTDHTQNADDRSVAEQPTSFWLQHRLLTLLISTIVIAIIFVSVGMVLYTVSGAAQLDLSRPGYKSVSDQVELSDKSNEYDASGSVTKESINEFIKLFDEQAEKTKGVDAFRGDPLNPDVLFFDSSKE